jgi:Type II CAAX prenyl endopeptidase Rce1-like
MRSVRATWAGHGDLLASLTLMFPLALIVGVGVAVTHRVNAVDVASRLLWCIAGRDRDRYLLMYAAMAVGFLAWLRHRGRRDMVAVAVVLPLIAESALYALTLVAAITFAVDHHLGLGAVSALGAVGAGLHEELLFRLLGVAGGAAIARRSGLGDRPAIVVAALGSSLLFACAHHWAGEPWQVGALISRFVAGLVFATIFWRRSLAHAVYAHVLYDLWIVAVSR